MQATPLELMREPDSPPRIEVATPIEGTDVTARRVPGAPVAGFAAFLDGIQRSTVQAHVAGVPIVHGAIAAAVRARRGRRLGAWETPLRSHACYLPVELVDPTVVESIAGRCPVVDTLVGLEAGAPVPRHPGDLAARALTAVQRAREAAERTLAERWVAAGGDGPLLVDGGIAGSETIARAANVVGAVKSHRTLYAAGDSLPAILGLREGERTTAISVSSPRRTPVATWYLRLRDPQGRGPMFGLVRVEVAHPGESITERADLVSRWLLAERAPVSLPDARWDVMVYGIRECEEYLSAILR